MSFSGLLIASATLTRMLQSQTGVDKRLTIMNVKDHSAGKQRK